MSARGETRVVWSQHCPGCTETPEGERPAERGVGCDECGYTGRRRFVRWVPKEGNGHG